MANRKSCLNYIMISVCLIHLITTNCYAAGVDSIDLSSSSDFSAPKRSGFLPMRGRKWLEEGSQTNSINNRLHLLKSFLDQLVDSNSLDESYGVSSLPINRLSSAFDSSGRNKKRPESASYQPLIVPDQYGYPLSGWFGQFLGNSIGNSPKRAGFLPMRGRKSDPQFNLESSGHLPITLPFLYDERLSAEQDKRAGFMPMRGKKEMQEFATKRAFHALRG